MLALDLNYLSTEEPWSYGNGLYIFKHLPDERVLFNIGKDTKHLGVRLSGAIWSLYKGNSVVSDPFVDYSGDLNLAFQINFMSIPEVEKVIDQIRETISKYRLFNLDHKPVVHRYQHGQSLWVTITWVHISRVKDFEINTHNHRRVT